MNSDWWYLIALQNYALVLLGFFVWKGFLFAQPLLIIIIVYIATYLGKRKHARRKNELQ
jgi:hypothetical protein